MWIIVIISLIFLGLVFGSYYWFNIIKNKDVEKIKTKPDVWNISFKEDYKWENNK